jgi:serine-type D-Ala-D-Ala carboxypeptidase (penicillin-binding protein 5/6)
VYRGERKRHERTPDGAHSHRTGDVFALLPREQKVPRRAAERQDAGLRLAVRARPEEEPSRPQLEAAELAELDLEAPLSPAYALWRAVPFDQTHLDLNLYAGSVFRRLALLAGLLLSLAAAQTATATTPPPSVKASAALLVDGNSGETLYALNPDRRLPMASLTKLMTALLTMENTNKDDTVRVEGPAPSVGESTINLQAGERLKVKDLLAAALIQSANDAAYALAADVGGSVKKFIRMMNERAAALGLDHTHYVVPDGLDTPGHYSSAMDTYTLAREDMKHALFRRIVAQSGGEIAGGRTLYAWNDLLKTYPGAIGIKTGHTDLAGWSEIAAAERDGVTMYAVILGGPTRGKRNRDLGALLDWGFGQYGRVQVISRNKPYAEVAVPFSGDEVALVAEDRVRATVPLDHALVEKVVAPESLDLPISQGDPVGEIVVYDGDKIVARRPLVSSETVGEPSLPVRVRWYAGRALDEAGDMLSSLSPF